MGEAFVYVLFIATLNSEGSVRAGSEAWFTEPEKCSQVRDQRRMELQEPGITVTATCQMLRRPKPLPAATEPQEPQPKDKPQLKSQRGPKDTGHGV